MVNNKPVMTYLIRMIAYLALILSASGIQAETRETTYYVPDALGSPIAAMDEVGNIKWRKHYQPYGAEIEQGEASKDNHIGYTGHVHDRDTGLTYMGARYYDPAIGRFMSMDPAGVNPNDPRTFNRYAYAHNRPYNYVDPDGRSPDDVAVWTTALIEPSPFGEIAAAIYTVGKYTLIGLGVWGGAEGIIQLNENADNVSDDSGEDSACSGCADENRPQDKKLTKGDIKKLIKGNVHPHDLKDNSKQDLFKDRDGNIIVKPRSGDGPGEETGLNINDF